MNVDAKLAQSCRPQKAMKNHAVAAEVSASQPPILGNSHSPAYVSEVERAEPGPTKRIRQPLGRDGYVLYLDFDGVLHHENVRISHTGGPFIEAPERYTLFQHAELLASLLRPYPDVLIVLSTSWAVRYGVTAAAKKLPPELQSRVIGGTFHNRYMQKQEFLDTHRGRQVAADVFRRQPRDWLALDDDEEGWHPAHLSHFVQTHMYEGISAPAVLGNFTKKLEAMCKPQKTPSTR